VLLGAAWQLVPDPFDDFRFLVLLATFASATAILALPGAFGARLTAAAVVAANPLAVHGAWFGTTDATSLVFLVLAFAFVFRRRPVAAAVALALAIVVRQFAVVAIPFVVAALIVQRVPRRDLVRAGGGFAAVLAAVILPFLLADPREFWEGTVEVGGSTYRIVGYGLSALLLRAGIVDDREGAYPFGLFVVLFWVPLTAWLVWAQLRRRVDWLAPAGFAVSMFMLLYIARPFHKSYLIWPLTALVIAALVAVGERRGSAAFAPHDPDGDGARRRGDVAGVVARDEP
jgi:uncharacterized membrane protein